MSYFSRLTDIVTCSLTRILADESDQKTALEQIIREIKEGVSGAKRSVATATTNKQNLQDELTEHRQQIGYWTSKAKESLAAGNDDQARLSLVRKGELDDLIAGLQQQYDAAIATCEHLTTMQKALDARLAEALRKQQAMLTGVDRQTDNDESPAGSLETDSSIDDSRATRIEDELSRLKRELEQE